MKNFGISAALAALAILFVSFGASAQFRYGPTAGVNISHLKMNQDLVPTSGTIGAQAGIQAELMFPGIGFGMDMGLLYNMTGGKLDLGSRPVWATSGLGNETALIHMIQIPLHLRFKWTRMNGLEDYIAPFVSGGPDFGIVAGHGAVKGTDGVHPFKYAAGDVGLSVGGGAEVFRRWQVSFQYTWGMTNILHTRKLDNYTGRNGQWTVRAAYLF